MPGAGAAMCIVPLVENIPLIQGPNQALVLENIAPGTRETFSPGWSHQSGLRVNNRMLRHPIDGSQWRGIDREFPEFTSDARNLRFALSTDGMNSRRQVRHIRKL